MATSSFTRDFRYKTPREIKALIRTIEKAKKRAMKHPRPIPDLHFVDDECVFEIKDGEIRAV